MYEFAKKTYEDTEQQGTAITAEDMNRIESAVKHLVDLTNKMTRYVVKSFTFDEGRGIGRLYNDMTLEYSGQSEKFTLNGNSFKSVEVNFPYQYVNPPTYAIGSFSSASGRNNIGAPEPDCRTSTFNTDHVTSIVVNQNPQQFFDCSVSYVVEGVVSGNTADSIINSQQ